MDEVLETRERALVAGARNLYSEELNKAERQIRELAKKAESNGIPSVLDKRPELLALYSDLELKSLKKGSVEGAKAAIAQAEKSGAEKWAPKTFKLAQEQIKLVTGVLDADRTQTAKAQAHAAKTIWLAGQAMAITTLAKRFDAENYTLEDILLWYHGQLEEISQPLGEPIPLDKDNRELVLAMRDDIAALKKGLEDTRAVMKQYQDQVERVMEGSRKQRANMEIAMREVLNADRKDLVALRKKYAEYLSAEGKSTAMSEERDVALKRIAEEIKNSFTEDEASVSLRDGNILIILHGVEFAKNKADISARSFGLLNKVALAVQEVPDCDIEISGHTDSRGRVAKNIEVSQQRADAIKKFLTEVGGVNAQRIKAQGLGSSKPITNNNTAEGRRQNRRVEVLLVNE
jgi:outer membrane protein OmpA-like peptidoglycan-associated protein